MSETGLDALQLAKLTLPSSFTAYPKQVRTRCGSGCGTGSKVIAFGSWHGNSPVIQVRQDDEGEQGRIVRQDALAARRQCLRILGRSC